MAAKKKTAKKAAKKTTKKAGKNGANAKKSSGKMSRDEQIGYHKGALSTLAKERQELYRILQIVEQLMQFHLGSLQQLGIDLSQEMQAGTGKAGKGQKGSPKRSRPIDEII